MNGIENNVDTTEINPKNKSEVLTKQEDTTTLISNILKYPDLIEIINESEKHIRKAAYAHHELGKRLEKDGNQINAIENYKKAIDYDNKNREYLKSYNSLKNQLKPILNT